VHEVIVVIDHRRFWTILDNVLTVGESAREKKEVAGLLVTQETS
jgi:hypothetical protein